METSYLFSEVHGPLEALPAARRRERGCCENRRRGLLGNTSAKRSSPKGATNPAKHATKSQLFRYQGTREQHHNITGLTSHYNVASTELKKSSDRTSALSMVLRKQQLCEEL